MILIKIRQDAFTWHVNKNSRYKKKDTDKKAFIKNVSDNNKIFFRVHKNSSFISYNQRKSKFFKLTFSAILIT